MDIRISKLITGMKEETYTAVASLIAKATVSYKLEDGKDIRDEDPETARNMVEDAKRELKETLVREVTKDVIDRLTKEAKDGIVITPFVKRKLTLMSLSQYAKSLKVKPLEREEVVKKTPKEVKEHGETT